MVAEDEHPLAERVLGRRDPGVELVGRRVDVSVRETRLESEHHVVPLGEELRLRPAGTAWSPTAGLSAPEPICGPHSRPGFTQPNAWEASRSSRVPGQWEWWCSGLPPGRSPTARARTSSRTPRAGCIYVGKAKSLRSRLSNYFGAPELAARRAPARWSRPPTSVEWIEVAQRGRGALPRVQPHQAAPAALQHPATRTTSPTRSSRSRSTRSGRGRW